MKTAAGAALLAVILASTRRVSVHAVGTALAAVLFVASFILPGVAG